MNNLIPNSEEINTEYNSIEPSKTFKYNFEDGSVGGNIDEVEALKQTIIIILSTPRYAYEIYDGSFGHELYTLIGQPKELIISEAPRLIEEALLEDDRILSVSDFEFNQTKIDSIEILFKIKSVFGDIWYTKEVSY